MRRAKFTWEDGFFLNPIWETSYVVMDENVLKFYKDEQYYSNFPLKPIFKFVLKKNHHLLPTKRKDYSSDPSKTIELEYLTIVKNMFERSFPVLKVAVLSPDSSGLLASIREHIDVAYLHLGRQPLRIGGARRRDY
ncbi:unnamed protein product [Heterosigma akashiwo]